MDAKAHQRRFLRQIKTDYPYLGDHKTLRPTLRRAFMACPRHRFLKRFKMQRNGPTFTLTKRTANQLLPIIYAEYSIQIYVDKNGKALPATNSEAGFVLNLLEVLDLRRGQRVMEIGSGGGWLAALAAHVVGPRGEVVGIEVIPALAEHSRRCIRSLGREINLDHLTIITGDGGRAVAPSLPYDRVIVTTGSHSFPVHLFNQVADGGKVLIPLSARGGHEELFLLQKDENRFRSIMARPARYVPMVGATKLKDFRGKILDELPLWQRLREQPCFSQPFWLGGRGQRELMNRSIRFRSYLSKTEPNYSVFIDKNDKTHWHGSTFGVVDEKAGSIALVEGNNLDGYGSPKAANTLLRHYRDWTRAFMPAVGCFDLEVFQSGKAPRPRKQQWLERRGSCDFLWSLGDGTSDPYRRAMPMSPTADKRTKNQTSN